MTSVQALSVIQNALGHLTEPEDLRAASMMCLDRSIEVVTTSLLSYPMHLARGTSQKFNFSSSKADITPTVLIQSADDVEPVHRFPTEDELAATVLILSADDVERFR